MKVNNDLLLIILFIFSINCTDFGPTSIKLSKISGGTVILMLYPQKGGTTEGSDLKILNLKLVCNTNSYSKEYPLTCPTNKQHSLTTEGYPIQCSISESISASTSCGLYGTPTIQSSNDIFLPVLENTVTSEESKFGDTSIGIVSVEGTKVIIKIYPYRTDTTTSDDLFIYGLTINGQELTCKANEQLNLVANTGTELECSTLEEINGNILLGLSGSPFIFSTGDTFGKITLKSGKTTSSFGQVKVGLQSVLGTTVTLKLTPEYAGSVEVDITGLKINDEKVLDCPSKTVTLTKEGINYVCYISQAMGDGVPCTLTENNLNSDAFPKLVIDESNKECAAGSSKYGKVNIILESVLGSSINILIKTSHSEVTESDRLKITGLSLESNSKQYLMTCQATSKLNLKTEGTQFTCTITQPQSGAKECKLIGTPMIISEGDTFSDITVSSDPVISSFGYINIQLVSIIGSNVKIRLVSQYSGTTISSITSINNLQLNSKPLTCNIGQNINFSNKPEYVCTLVEEMNGNVECQLSGNSPLINMEADGQDIFGNINIDTTKKTSSFGQLKITLKSVIGNKVTISLMSDYIGTMTSLSVYSLYLNGKSITCNSGSIDLELKKSDGTSNADIVCSFSDDSYSEETNNLCILTGNPNTLTSLFTSHIIGTPYQVDSGVRNFGETSIYLDSIKGTTVYLKVKPSLSGKVRPIISNLKLQSGSNQYDVKCDISDKIQLYSSYGTKIKCYISQTISSQCNLINDGRTTITTTTGDLFGSINVNTDPLTPSSSSCGDTQIELISIIGTKVTIEVTVTTNPTSGDGKPIIHNLNLDGKELYCVASDAISFTNKKATMTCTSSTEIQCTQCKLSGNPTIISSDGYDDTFGNAIVNEEKEITPTDSTLGKINIKLDEVIGTDVYIDISSTNNGKDTNKVDINNLYINGQSLTCTDNFKFSTTPTKIKCSIDEPIPYDQPIELTGTPSIKIYSDEESTGVVEISENEEPIKSKSNSALVIKIISVKENYVIITIDATGFDRKTLIKKFTLYGLKINDIPFEINYDEIYLGGGAVELKVDLSEPITSVILCSLTGMATAQGTSEDKTFGPITSPTGNQVYSTVFKFGKAELYLSSVQGYTVKYRITTTKSAYTYNTILEKLSINNIPLICNFDNNIEFNSYGTEVQCKINTPIDGNALCTLYYKGEGDDNFEEIKINEEYKTVTSSYNYFGNVVISLIEANFKNIKIKLKTRITGTTTTNNFQIKNLYINDIDLSCQYNKKIEFTSEGVELDCIMDSSDVQENYVLSQDDAYIISLGDKFDEIEIDENHNSIRSLPKDIDDLTIYLSSVTEEYVTLKLTTSVEIYTYIKVLNLKIKNIQNSNTYSLLCPKVYINMKEENNFISYIKCAISTKIEKGIYFSLVNNDEVSIDSYDNFENIMVISTDKVISTKFGDMFIKYVSSSIIVDIISTNQAKTLDKIYLKNLKLDSSLSEFYLDCDSEEQIILKPSGTKLQCTLKGEIKLTKSEIEPEIETVYEQDTFENIILEQEINDVQSINCYAFYDKDSCEMNKNCIYSKDTITFCENKYENIFEDSEINNNYCHKFSKEETCEAQEECFWNEEYKYTCKPKLIKNCEIMNIKDFTTCEECEKGYELNPDSTKCISKGDIYYPCKEYTNPTTCNSKSKCEYFQDGYNYCVSNEDENIDNNCYLYITRDACNSQENCVWKTNSNPGCNEKYIENCIKLRESDPSSCEKCEDGYHLLSGKTCTVKTMNEKEQCEELIDDRDNCLEKSFCEFSRRAFCYGGEGCYRYLTQELCQRYDYCYWNSGNWNRCKIKKISNCLQLSADDANICEQCQEGYSLINYGTTCSRITDQENDFKLCYSNEEYECENTDICQFSKRSYCRPNSEENENEQCFLYLDKDLCEKNDECEWIEETEEICQVKNIENCLELNINNVNKCEKCKDGYKLNEELTECLTSISRFIKATLFSLALIIFLL